MQHRDRLFIFIQKLGMHAPRETLEIYRKSTLKEEQNIFYTSSYTMWRLFNIESQNGSENIIEMLSVNEWKY